MKKVLAYLSVPLLLAACSAPSTPQGNESALRTVTINAASLAAFRPQGITDSTPALNMNVRVRTSDGRELHFAGNGTTYDPTGTGTAVITLNHDNGYMRDLLLPEGSYTFEVAGLDAASGSALLTYGPGSENAATVDANGAVIRLKAHSVLDPAASTLEPAMNLPTLFTDTRFTLNLRLKTAGVNGTSGAVPTSDIGPVTYSVGAASDGDLTLPGSKLGVQVTSRGTDTDAELNVAANFSAWVRVAGTDTAAFAPVQVNFAKQIQKNGLTADMIMPTVTVQTPADISPTQTGVLNGTATDDHMIRSIQVYDGVTLIASTDAGDNVAPVTTDASGAWSAPWSSAEPGEHTLSVVVNDDSGNERRETVKGNVKVVVATDVTIATDSQPNVTVFSLTAGVPQTFTIHLDDALGGSFLAFFNPGTCTSSQQCPPQAVKQFTSVLTDANGTVIPLMVGDHLGYAYDFTEDLLPAGTYTLTVTPSADTQLSIWGTRY